MPGTDECARAIQFTLPGERCEVQENDDGTVTISLSAEAERDVRHIMVKQHLGVL